MQRSLTTTWLLLLLVLVYCPTQSYAQVDNSLKGPERWEKVIQTFEARDATTASPKGKVLLIGGSNARRWKDVDNYFPDQTILNRGFGGARLYEILHYFDRLVVPYQPKVIILNAGGNDMNAGRTPEQVHETTRAFMVKVHATLPDTRVLYIGLPYVMRAKERPELLPVLKQFNQGISELANKDESLTFIDIFPDSVNDEGGPRPELYVEDGIHFTAKLYEMIAERLEEKL